MQENTIIEKDALKSQKHIFLKVISNSCKRVINYDCGRQSNGFPKMSTADCQKLQSQGTWQREIKVMELFANLITLKQGDYVDYPPELEVITQVLQVEEGGRRERRKMAP